LFEIFRRCLGRVCIALPVSDYKGNLFSLFKSQLFETDPQPFNDLVPCVAREEDTNTVELWLLRFGGHANNHHRDAYKKVKIMFHRFSPTMC
jgi:hypothetical protein